VSTKIISPIDGSLYAERPLASDQAVSAAISRARAAQAEAGAGRRLPTGEGCLLSSTRSSP
jgi:acyl-CoA reductase-like NAD-dependent aldehyde dehydrogenase